jgi:hypothetical protein
MATGNVIINCYVTPSLREELQRREEFLDELRHLEAEHRAEADAFYRLAGQQVLFGQDQAAVNVAQAELHEHTASALRMARQELSR